MGMEVDRVIAITDYLTAQPEIDASKVGVWGLGQGGMTALYAAAIDERLADATVQDYFRQREESWREPVGSSLVWPAQRIWGCRGGCADCAEKPDDRLRVPGDLSRVFYSVHSEADKIRMCQYLLQEPNDRVLISSAAVALSVYSDPLPDWFSCHSRR
jgi:hypothetical protein